MKLILYKFLTIPI